MRIRWKPDNSLPASAEIASHASHVSNQLEHENDPARAKTLYVAWCKWAEQRRVCQQIIDHIDDKFWFKFPAEKKGADTTHRRPPTEPVEHDGGVV
jgi:hypothetical protein